MSELPQGWASATVSQLIDDTGLFSDGDWVESKDQDPNGKNRLIQLADIGDGYFVNKSSRFVNEEQFNRLGCTELKENDVLVARMPDPLGRACLMPNLSQRCLTVVDIAIIRPGENSVLPELLVNLINAPQVRSAMASLATGTTRQRISRGNLSGIEIPVPPILEQKRIADKLDTLRARVDATRERLDRIPVILKRFRQAVLAAATSGRLTKVWREENEIEMAWAEEKLGDVIDEMRNGLSPKPSDQPVGVKILRISSIRSGAVDYSDHKYLSLDYKEIDRYRLLAGDLLFTRYNGSLEFVGVCAVVRQLSEDFVYPDKLIRVRVRKDKVLSSFVEIIFSSPKVRSFIEGFVKSTSGQKGISGGDLKSVLFQLPTIEEQKEIVRHVENLFALADKLEARYTTARAQVDKLTPALLAKAFRGELVEQDPNDEPAAVLLERIRAAREVAPNSAKKGRKQ